MSEVWKYFEKIKEGKASCNLCNKHYKTSGNTTNLVAHLKAKHEAAYQAFLESKKFLADNKKVKNGFCFLFYFRKQLTIILYIFRPKKTILKKSALKMKIFKTISPHCTKF